MAFRPISLRAGILLVAATLFLIGGSCAFVVKAFVDEQQGALEVICPVPPGTKDYIRVEGYIVVVDPTLGRMELELFFYPHGRFDAGGGLLAVPVEVEVSSLNGESLKFESNRRMFPRLAEFGFWDGSVADYPFDIHQIRIELRILEVAKGDGPAVAVPTEFDLDTHFHGLAIKELSMPANEHGYVGAAGEIRRSSMVIGTVAFCMVIMWALTAMNLLMLWAVLTRRMEVDVELFAYMSGMIVALYFFREVLPDAPPFLGVLADYTAFFWAELITAVCAVVFAMIWYRQLIKRAPAVTNPPWSTNDNE